MPCFTLRDLEESGLLRCTVASSLLFLVVLTALLAYDGIEAALSALTGKPDRGVPGDTPGTPGTGGWPLEAEADEGAAPCTDLHFFLLDGFRLDQVLAPLAPNGSLWLSVTSFPQTREALETFGAPGAPGASAASGAPGSSPWKAEAFVSVASPPTYTTNRLMAMFTGSEPSKMDLLLAFSPVQTKRRSAFSTIAESGGSLMVYGDDTIAKLFKPWITHADVEYSYHIADYDTVDDIVEAALEREACSDPARECQHLGRQNSSASAPSLHYFHFLGGDHIMHSEGLDSPELARRIARYDSSIARYIRRVQFEDVALGRRSCFVLTSDHGMTSSGGHGGGSLAEVETPLVVAAPMAVWPPFSPGERIKQTEIANLVLRLLSLPLLSGTEVQTPDPRAKLVSAFLLSFVLFLLTAISVAFGGICGDERVNAVMVALCLASNVSDNALTWSGVVFSVLGLVLGSHMMLAGRLRLIETIIVLGISLVTRSLFPQKFCGILNVGSIILVGTLTRGRKTTVAQTWWDSSNCVPKSDLLHRPINWSDALALSALLAGVAVSTSPWLSTIASLVFYNWEYLFRPNHASQYVSGREHTNLSLSRLSEKKQIEALKYCILRGLMYVQSYDNMYSITTSSCALKLSVPTLALYYLLTLAVPQAILWTHYSSIDFFLSCFACQLFSGHPLLVSVYLPQNVVRIACFFVMIVWKFLFSGISSHLRRVSRDSV